MISIRWGAAGVLLLLAPCNPSLTCSNPIVYDAVGGNYSEVYHTQHETVYIVPKDAEMNSSTSSEFGGSLVIGESPKAVWLDWPLGFAMSDQNKFKTPDMTCETATLRKPVTKTTCVGKDGGVWLSYIADEHGVYEYKRHEGEFQDPMRRRGRCALTFEGLRAMEEDYTDRSRGEASADTDHQPDR